MPVARHLFQRVLITGCGGMLGNAVYPYFQQKCGLVVATDKETKKPWLSHLDVRDRDRLAQVIDDLRPDLILHLAAETDLEFCETHPDIAEATNAVATRGVAELAERSGATLVYISTAGVFDGGKQDAYTEHDPANPIMVYGQTKYDGEEHVRAVCGRAYVVRAGWMVGGGRANDHKFVSKILTQLADGKQTIHAVDDKWGTPTYTHDFAMNLFALLESRKYGLYHMVCEGAGTRFDIAKEIVKICGLEHVQVKPVSSDFFKATYFAPRPRSEMMVNANLRALGLNRMRPWDKALREYLLKDYADIICRSQRRSETPVAVVGGAASDHVPAVSS